LYHNAHAGTKKLGNDGSYIHQCSFKKTPLSGMHEVYS